MVGAGSPSGLGPFYISDLLGLDTCVAVAEHMHESYGDRFTVHAEMRELVKAGRARRQDREGLL